jgi:ABC-type phosphate transport system permease subunit
MYKNVFNEIVDVCFSWLLSEGLIVVGLLAFVVLFCFCRFLGLTDLEGLFVLAVLGCFIGLGLEMFAG